MAIAIIHSLAAEQLDATRKFLEAKLQTKTELYQPSEISLIPLNSQILFLHFDLKEEILTHQKLYLDTKELGYENFLNPYDQVAELADDKFAFSQFLLANEFNCPQSKKYQKLCHFEDLGFSDFVLKPNSGTENIDVYFSSEFSDTQLVEHAQKILSYDDLLVQERIAFQAEYRVVSLCGKLYANKEDCPDFPRNDLKALLDILASNFDYDVSNSIVAFDLLLAVDRCYIIEINIRPAALFAFSQELKK